MSTQPDHQSTKSPITHTPGPWRVRLHDAERSAASYNGASIISESGLRVVSIPRNADRPYEQKRGDAHLIAAAPAMKEALQAALRHVSELREAWARGVIREGDSLGGTRSNLNVEVESLLVAAIAKAEGR